MARWPEVREHLDAVLDLAPEAREAYLDEHCGDDGDLRTELEAFLDSEHEVTPFIERPLVDLLAARPRKNREGQRLGAYLLGPALGQGGMGEVYLASRADDVYEQEVAVKILKRGLDTSDILRRFDHERRILARLEHPRVARILDGGSTDDGLPYFVMERVAGAPIDRYCETEELPLGKVLELFVQVCETVHFAHTNLVVHCDLKPGNILVGPDGTPKLLDFGIAKLLHPEGSDKTRTLLRMGTPDFVSPEQEKGEPITTASDVYSLGALLRRLVSLQGPSPPSRPALRGDLGNVVDKAMHPEPSRRYASANELAEDVRRFLEHRPVTARPDSLLYRARRFVRRHPGGVALSAVAAALVAVFVVALYHQLRLTEAQRDRALGLRDTVLELLASIDPTSPKAGSEQAVAAVEEALGTELSSDPADRALLLDRIGRMYYRLGFLELARQRLEESLAIRRSIPEPPETIAESLSNLGLVLTDMGRNEEGLAMLEEAIVLREKYDRDHPEEMVKARAILARSLTEDGRYRDAERIIRKQVEARQELHGEDSKAFATGVDSLATNLFRQGKIDEAEAFSRRALALWRRLLGPEHPDVATSLVNLASILDAQGDHRSAIDLHRQALAIRHLHFGEDSVDVARSSAALAFSLLGAGAPDELVEAEARLRKAIAVYQEKRGTTHSHTLIFRRNLAATLLARGDAGAAETEAREVVELALAGLDPDHWRIADARSVLGHTLLAQGRDAEAERLLVDSLPVIRNATGEYSRYTREARERVDELRRRSDSGGI